MPVPQMDYGETLPQYYRRLFDLVRRMDPKAILGACSPNEIERMKGRFVQLETEAAEKAKRESTNDPCNIASGKLRELWKRAHEAYVKIPELQQSAKPYRSAFKIIGVPDTLFEAPEPHGIPQSGGRLGWTVADHEAYIAEVTPTVDALEVHAATLRRHVAAWEHLTSEQQIWKALNVLAERLNG
jgi:hypothetical protein